MSSKLRPLESSIASVIIPAKFNSLSVSTEHVNLVSLSCLFGGNRQYGKFFSKIWSNLLANADVHCINGYAFSRRSSADFLRVTILQFIAKRES